MLFGSEAGPLEVVKELGWGGFGTVYQCRHGSEMHAVKVLSGSVQEKDLMMLGERMAEKECLRHKNVLNVHELFNSILGPAIRMPFLEGADLFSFAGKLNDSQALKAVKGIADGLNYLHMRGYAHRDIKPDNVVFNTKGNHATVIDLGTLRPCGQRASVQGTPDYMAPEARGKKFHVVKSCLDDWSFGVTIAVCILGELVKYREGCLACIASVPAAKPTSRCLLQLAANMMEPDADTRLTSASLLRKLQLHKY
jgi:serine/threonine protein kinase